MKEKFFLIITLLFLQISTSAQKNKDQVENSKVNNIFFATGITLPIANDIADVYAYGFSAKIGVSFNIYKQNLFIEPSFSFNGFNKDIAYSSAYDKTKIFSVSLPIALKILPNFTNNSLFLLSSIDYNFISNDISSKSFDLFSFSKSNNRTNIMKGKGISFLFGIRYHIISWLSVEAGYNYIPIQMRLADDLYNFYNANGLIVSKSNKMDFSQFKVSVKYNLINF